MKHKGFTLIELVIVIIVLGILAATAVPKFINIQSDARISTLKGAEGAILSANSLVYSKAVIQGIENSSGAVSTGGSSLTRLAPENSIDTVKGNIVMTAENLKKAMTTTLNLVNHTKDGGVLVSIDKNTMAEINDSQCYLLIQSDPTEGTLYFNEDFSGC
ncbi:prepilin-type N-terminal cleavage/methylation domain-containing protein [Moritella sp. 24]|uniref:prepilin-type N-terminal cleavage/methylation domain-containing protein n=1 Tax=Moritella sp. 24 TaxID=2746230 RepID=UPI001BAC9AB2|nr:prepilin-type N-terminal cleavage/methylation domain-containing protein [Moritella sp. 24]QUM76304.1 prepilin-type N-terminal cleavage/methylation domain-containing protein [Moritella sp. 24]